MSKPPTNHYRKTRLRQKQLPVMQAMRDDGMSLKQIADKYEITYGALVESLSRYNQK